MSDSTVRVSKQTNKELGHIAIDLELSKKELLEIIVQNLQYDEEKQKLKMETEV